MWPDPTLHPTPVLMPSQPDRPDPQVTLESAQGSGEVPGSREQGWNRIRWLTRATTTTWQLGPRFKFTENILCSHRKLYPVKQQLHNFSAYYQIIFRVLRKNKISDMIINSRLKRLIVWLWRVGCMYVCLYKKCIESIIVWNISNLFFYDVTINYTHWLLILYSLIYIIHISHICIYMWTHICIYMWTHICIYMWTHICIYVNTYLYIYVNTYIIF